MPGRISVRAARQSTQSTKSRAGGRNVSSATDALDEGPSTSLREQICAIFADIQKSATGQRKLVVRLRRVQESCCYEPAQGNIQCEFEDFDEEQINRELTRCILRVLLVKKGEPVGDRLVKFLGLFLRHATDADNAIFSQEDSSGVKTLPETPTSRLTSHILSTILPLQTAKDKVVRFRCTQIISHLINTLDSIDDELFDQIRLGLLKRLRDKESMVRVQAVYGLGRLAGEAESVGAEDDSDDDAAGGIIEKLLDVLQNDSSTDVRRAILLNLPFTPTTLPFLLERARDLDGGIRRALYSRLLPALGDFRHLSLTHREKLLRWGLRDRDDNVKKATAKLFSERWIEDCARPRDEDGSPIEFEPGHVSEPSLDGLLELLERVDVVNVGGDGGVALDAMKEFWQGRPDYRSFIMFDESFWTRLTPESVFVARTFNDYCRADGNPDSLSEKIPEVTRFAFLIQQNVNSLVEQVRTMALQEDADEDSGQQEFVVEQLLQIALTLDYSDEVGRRAMFSLMREMLALPELPEEATKLVVDVLRLTCGVNSTSERDFCGVVLEAIAEVHDTILGDDLHKTEDHDNESFHSAQSDLSGDITPKRSQGEDSVQDEERAIREIMVNMKCLHIAQCMLQNVECSLEQNSHLVTMLNNLVVPAVRSQEAPIRERGLLCLGLCCLLDKNLAEENLTLFLHCFTKGHEALQNIAVQIIGDILSAHPSLLFTEATDTAEESENLLQKPIHKLFSKGLKSESAPVQSTTCATLCKLLLTSPSSSGTNSISILNSDELLRLLTTAYFNPDTAGNAALRQSLSYFLPMYCHSRAENMQRMGRIALSILHWCIGMKEEMDVEDDDDSVGEMVGIGVVVSHLADWTDSRKLAHALEGASGQNSRELEGDVHLQLGKDAFEKVLGVSSKDERKFYVSLIGKIHISESSQPEKLQSLLDLVNEAIEERIAEDATSRNVLSKIQAALRKATSTTTQPAARGGCGVKSALDDTSEQTGVYSDTDANNRDHVAVDGDHSTESLLQSIANTPAPSPKKKSGGGFLQVDATADAESEEDTADLTSHQMS